ncbi:MAG: hypothetical protein ACOYOV_15790 [Bacteroidales bacterium]
MKNKLFFIYLVVFTMLPYMIMAQYDSKYKLTNFKQVDETSFTFDLELHNIGITAFGLDAADVRINFNQAMFAGQTLYAGKVLSCISTDLVGEYSHSIADWTTPPIISQMTASYNSGYIVYATEPLPAGVPMIDLFQPGTFKKLATIKVQFVIGTTPPTTKYVPFDEVLHNLAFESEMINNTVLRVNTYDAVTYSPIVIRDGSDETFSSILVSSVENLPTSTANRKLAKYCFTGIGDFATDARWNNATSTTITGYHTTPPSLANVLISGNATLSSNQSLTDLTLMTNTGTLTMNAGTQLSVDGNLYNDNATAGALTLKADGGLHPTASLKNNTASVTATVEQYITSNWYSSPADGWHLLSSPVANQSISGSFTPTGNLNGYDFFAWDEASSWWFNQKQGNNLVTFTPGSGYLVAYEQSGTKTFTGSLNAANLTKNLSYESTDAVLKGWNLIGNPYPCAINWTIGSWTKTNIESYAKVWDGVGNNYIDVTLQETPNRYIIPAMQGFFVKANGTSPSIVIPADAKVHSGQGFYKTTQDMLVMKVSKDNAPVYDKAAICFNSLSTNLYDPTYDATEMPSFGDAPGLYSLLANGEKLSINTIPLPGINTLINMCFIAGTNATYTFTASNLANISFTHPIVLEDTKTGLSQDLFQNPIYQFTADTNDNIHRFILHFNASATGIQENENNNTLAYCKDGQVVVSSHSFIKTIEVYNEIGQQLGVYKVNGNSFSAKISGKVQILRILTNENTIVRKLVVL